MKFRFVTVLALFAAAVTFAHADARVDAVIAKARAALGSESALNAVKSIHFVGKFSANRKVPVSADSKELKDEAVVLGLDIVFQKPFQHRMIRRSATQVETTALDGYDAWVRNVDTNDDKKWRLQLLDATQIRSFRANTWESLYFYRGIEKEGGRVEHAGEATIDGKDCVKLVFIHAGGIRFTRYFDKSTGRLVRTDTENGNQIREEGEMIVDGIRFPRTLVTRSAEGQLSTITFESVKVNERFPDSEFAVPSLNAR